MFFLCIQIKVVFSNFQKPYCLVYDIFPLSNRIKCWLGIHKNIVGIALFFVNEGITKSGGMCFREGMRHTMDTVHTMDGRIIYKDNGDDKNKICFD